MKSARLAVLCLFLTLSACDNTSFVEIPSVRTPLIDGIASYQSVEEVRKLLAGAYPAWQVIEDSGMRPGKTEGRPPNHVYRISISNYRHLGHFGRLELGFFNDRLMETLFFPDDLEGYLSVLEKQLPTLKTKRAVQITPFTQVLIGTNLRGSRYVAWEDTRLRDEKRRWIERYAMRGVREEWVMVSNGDVGKLIMESLTLPGDHRKL